MAVVRRFEVARVLLRLASPYRRQFAVVACLALLATGADLVAPLIYREAVNDIAGLFVGAPGTRGVDQLQRRAPAEAADATVASPGHARPTTVRAPEPHGRGQVSARTPEQTLRTLMWAVVLLFGVSVCSHGLGLLADQFTARLASAIEADVIQRTFGHVLRLPLQFFGRRPTAAVAKQIDQLDQVSPIVTAAAHEIAPEIVRMAGAIAIMMTQSWRLSLVALAMLPPYFWIVRRSARRLEQGLGGYYELWESVSARIQDALGAIKTVKLSGAEAREAARLRGESNAAYAIYLERNRLANRYDFWQTSLAFLSSALVLGYGGWLVLEHQLTPGDVVMFVAYLEKLFAPIESLTSTAVGLQQHVASLRRAVRLLATGAEEPGGAPLVPGPGRVEFRDLCFGYVPGRDVLKALNLTFEAGSVTALVGASGAGKTTAADLLLRLYEPGSGCILIDGQDIAGVDVASLRREVAVVAADGVIFSGTLADNIRYRRPEASDREVEEASVAAGLGATIARLPDGLATEVGERGLGLSLGERQRLQIARAILGRPRVLILDEATANLDYATELEIRRALLRRAERPTTIVIAHRYSMVEDADRVIVLADGRVAEDGTAAELIARGGWFAGFAAAAHGAAARDRDGEPLASDADEGEGPDGDEGSEAEDDGIEVGGDASAAPERSA